MKEQKKGAIPLAFEKSPPLLGIIRHYRLKPLCRARHYGFSPGPLNLIVETGIDGERIARERAEADNARRKAEAAQTAFFATTRNDNE